VSFVSFVRTLPPEFFPGRITQRHKEHKEHKEEKKGGEGGKRETS
jgi:hypothetical protein